MGCSFKFQAGVDLRSHLGAGHEEGVGAEAVVLEAPEDEDLLPPGEQGARDRVEGVHEGPDLPQRTLSCGWGFRSLVFVYGK